MKGTQAGVMVPELIAVTTRETLRVRWGRPPGRESVPSLQLWGAEVWIGTEGGS